MLRSIIPQRDYVTDCRFVGIPNTANDLSKGTLIKKLNNLALA